MNEISRWKHQVRTQTGTSAFTLSSAKDFATSWIGFGVWLLFVHFSEFSRVFTCELRTQYSWNFILGLALLGLHLGKCLDFGHQRISILGNLPFCPLSRSTFKSTIWSCARSSAVSVTLVVLAVVLNSHWREGSALTTGNTLLVSSGVIACVASLSILIPYRSILKLSVWLLALLSVAFSLLDNTALNYLGKNPFPAVSLVHLSFLTVSLAIATVIKIRSDWKRLDLSTRDLLEQEEQFSDFDELGERDYSNETEFSRIAQSGSEWPVDYKAPTYSYLKRLLIFLVLSSGLALVSYLYVSFEELSKLAAVVYISFSTASLFFVIPVLFPTGQSDDFENIYFLTRATALRLAFTPFQFSTVLKTSIKGEFRRFFSSDLFYLSTGSVLFYFILRPISHEITLPHCISSLFTLTVTSRSLHLAFLFHKLAPTQNVLARLLRIIGWAVFTICIVPLFILFITIEEFWLTSAFVPVSLFVTTWSIWLTSRRFRSGRTNLVVNRYA